MRVAERVADLVRGELPQPRERDARRIIGAAAAELGEADEALVEFDVLPRAQGAEDDHALDDLAGARIDDILAIGPAARGPVDPVDDIVARIHRIGAGGEEFGVEGIDEARRIEGLRPPVDPIEEGRADRLGGGGVDIEDDRLPDARAGRGGVCAFETEAAGDIAHDILPERGGEIDDLGG